jgi:hypothetical protein
MAQPDGIRFDLTDIDAGVREIISELGIPVRDVVNKIGLDLYADVTKLSPVLTGRYRASWNLNENTPDLGPASAFSKQPPQGTSLNAPSLTPADSLYPVLYLTNGLPYAVRIEEGWSHTKAPQGVLKVALAGADLL